MNKKMKEILAKIEEKTALANGYMEGENKDVEKATEIIGEIKALKAEYEAAKALYELDKEKNTPTDETLDKKVEEKKEVDSVKAFADAARHGFKGMNEGTLADGGYTVPEDITTKINAYRDAKFSLLSLVRVIAVKTMSGARTFKKKAQHNGFTTVGEGGKIGATGTPQYERIEYKITKKGGYMPVTNELLEDTDANLVGEVVEWFGEESRVTANKNILAVIQAKTAVAFAGLDDIKKALNVTLGQAYKATSKIITNDDGLQYLDTLKDADENYVLSKNPSDPMRLVLSAGATTVPVVVIPNSDLATVDKKIPFIVGDLNEGVAFFDRKQLSIKQSDVASIGDLNAFEEDLTLFRGIERNDVVARDTDAFVNGYILGE